MFQSLRKGLFVITVGFTVGTAQGQYQKACQGFLPPNDLKIPVSIFNNAGITEQQFNMVLDRLEKIYGPEIAAMGNRLKVNRLWSDPTVNASAQRSGKDFIINMYGGLARHAAINEAGFALVACHEIGHHLAGAPKVKGWFTTWASNEGASDYYATLKCLRRYFETDVSKTKLDEETLDTYARNACDFQWNTQFDREVCYWNSIAGQSVANLFAALRKEETPPMFNTPDRRQVSKTDDNHPATQCRLDTYFQGSLCAAGVKEPLSETDYRQGACHEGKDQIGNRPRCWFAP